MDYYPQPRPVLYGTLEDEPPPQTQTLPVRSGPPNYPPAPPLAGDAPDPFDGQQPGASALAERPCRLPDPTIASLLYILASVYAVVRFILDLPNFAGLLPQQTYLLVTIPVAFYVVRALWKLHSGSYGVALGLVGLQIVLGLWFGQAAAPPFWAGVFALVYLLRPSVFRQGQRPARLRESRMKQWRAQQTTNPY